MTVGRPVVWPEDVLPNLTPIVKARMDAHLRDAHTPPEGAPKCPVCSLPMADGLTAHIGEKCRGAWKPGYPIKRSACDACALLLAEALGTPRLLRGVVARRLKRHMDAEEGIR